MEFTWTIENFHRQTCRKLYSEILTVEGRKWRILLYPKGNNVDCLSIYLDVADSATLPKGWSRYLDFSLIVVNQCHPQLSISKKENDWGFTSFMSLNEFYDQARGYLVDDTVFIKAAIGAHKRTPKQRCEGKDNKGQFEAEADNFIILKVARDEDLEKQIGRDIYFDLVDHDKVCSFRFQKQAPFILFKEEVARKFDVPVQHQRFWIWTQRENHTYRPDRWLTPEEEAQSVGKVSKKVKHAEFKLFLEVEIGLNLRLISLAEKTGEDILLFLKLYNPEKEELRYVGRLFVNITSKPFEILARLNQMAGFDPDEEIELYEEIKYVPSVMCLPIDEQLSFEESELGNGDIVCYQRSLSLESKGDYQCPDVPSFMEFVQNQQLCCREAGLQKRKRENQVQILGQPPSRAHENSVNMSLLSESELQSSMKTQVDEQPKVDSSSRQISTNKCSEAAIPKNSTEQANFSDASNGDLPIATNLCPPTGQVDVGSQVKDLLPPGVYSDYLEKILQDHPDTFLCMKSFPEWRRHNAVLPVLYVYRLIYESGEDGLSADEDKEALGALATAREAGAVVEWLQLALEQTRSMAERRSVQQRLKELMAEVEKLRKAQEEFPVHDSRELLK